MHDAMLTAMLDLDDLSPARPRPLRWREYERLAEGGAFVDERVELLRGQIVTMSPQDWPHQAVMVWLNRELSRRLPDEFVVRPALPFVATDDSEPEPDLAVTLEPIGTRRTAQTAVLLIEIADSSLRKDRRIKLPIYAEAGVPEYWIVDVSRPGELAVEVYRDPSPSGYATALTLRDGDVLRPRGVPIEIAVADLPR